MTLSAKPDTPLNTLIYYIHTRANTYAHARTHTRTHTHIHTQVLSPAPFVDRLRRPQTVRLYVDICIHKLTHAHTHTHTYTHLSYTTHSQPQPHTYRTDSSL